jgi:hypothetical protein
MFLIGLSLRLPIKKVPFIAVAGTGTMIRPDDTDGVPSLTTSDVLFLKILSFLTGRSVCAHALIVKSNKAKANRFFMIWV